MNPFDDLTDAEARAYRARQLDGSGMPECGDRLQELARGRFVVDYGCGPGVDATRYRPDRYVGFEPCAPLLREARRACPHHRFEGDRAAVFPAAVVLVKQVLEHLPTAAEAVAVLEDARRLATEDLYVAWHTPPGPTEVLKRVTGASGRTFPQNVFARAAFARFAPEVERVRTNGGVHEVWRVAP